MWGGILLVKQLSHTTSFDVDLKSNLPEHPEYPFHNPYVETNSLIYYPTLTKQLLDSRLRPQALSSETYRVYVSQPLGKDEFPDIAHSLGKTLIIHHFLRRRPHTVGYNSVMNWAVKEFIHRFLRHVLLKIFYYSVI